MVHVALLEGLRHRLQLLLVELIDVLSELLEGVRQTLGVDPGRLLQPAFQAADGGATGEIAPTNDLNCAP